MNVRVDQLVEICIRVVGVDVSEHVALFKWWNKSNFSDQTIWKSIASTLVAVANKTTYAALNMSILFFFICFYLVHRQIRPVTLCESFFICVQISWDGSYGNRKRAADTKNVGERHWMFVSTPPPACGKVLKCGCLMCVDCDWGSTNSNCSFPPFEFGGSKPKTVQFVHFSSHRRSFSRK